MGPRWIWIGLILACAGCERRPTVDLQPLRDPDPRVRSDAARVLCATPAAREGLLAALKTGLASTGLAALGREPLCRQNLPTVALAPALVAGSQLGLWLASRERWLVGQPIWISLGGSAPEDLPEASRWWIETEAVLVRLDGRELPRRPFRIRQRLSDPNRRRLELAAWSGADGSQLGEHSLEIRFQARLSDPAGVELWSGELSAGHRSYSVVTGRPEDLLPGEAAPQPDPGESLELALHLGGKRIVVFPGVTGPLEVQLRSLPERAVLFATASRTLTVSLAFEVQVAATSQAGGGWRPAGTASASAYELGTAPFALGAVDLSDLRSGGAVELVWRLVPSRRVAWQHADVDSFWDHTLVLPKILIRTIVPRTD